MAVDAGAAAKRDRAAPVSDAAGRKTKPRAKGGKPPRAPPPRVSPGELVAGLAGSAVVLVVGGAAKLVRRRFRRKLSQEEASKLAAMKEELREAMEQLREQRRTMEHLAAQNREMARENQQLKRAAAEAAEAVSRASTPKAVLSLRTSPSESPEDAAPRDAADDVDPVVRRLVRDAVDAAVAADASRASATRHLNPNPKHTTLALSHIDEGEDAWAGVPRGSPVGAGSDPEDAEDARSTRSFASGFSGISDLSTLSAAEAALTRMRTKFVLMQRIRSHR
jgi:ABC-type multidrug transport system fused ATPase/permease subunit